MKIRREEIKDENRKNSPKDKMRTGSQKVQKWTSSDVAANITVYFVNFVLLFLIYGLIVYLEGKNMEAFFSDIGNILPLVILLALDISIMAVYFFFEDKDFLRNAVNSEMLFLILEIGIIVCYAVGKYVNVYLRPLTLVALITLFLNNRRSAIFMDAMFCITFILIGIYSGICAEVWEYTIFVVGFTSGILAVFFLCRVYSRLKLIVYSLIVSVPMVICYTVQMLETGAFAVENIICAACSGPLAIAVFILALPFFEASFKKVSAFKLAELTDHKNKLIRRMIAEAPGTFNHSIVLSNIAEACATAIDEDALLARTCAYYHDVGKLRRPEFFSENQTDGVNPHDDLTPELSTNIIKSHTQDGYQLVLKHRLPKIIADVCLQHHGTMPIWFFYEKAKKFTDGEVDVAQYSYQGPKPQSKIAAIIMIADGCEAASRALKDRSRENVKNVVRKIVNDRMELGQFDECEITIKELNIIIHTIVNNLTGIYHGRVEYPKISLDGIEKFQEATDGEEN